MYEPVCIHVKFAHKIANIFITAPTVRKVVVQKKNCPHLS